MDTLKFQITSRREFERLKRCDSATLTDLERVARFIYLQKRSRAEFRRRYDRPGTL